MSSIVLRGAQLALSAIALSKTAAYHSATHEANFILIATYSSMMYALWHLVCVEFLKIANRPRKLLSRIIDLGMAVLLVAAAISVKVAGYFPKCEPYRTNMIKCTDMSNIVVYTWVIVMPLICTFVLTYVVSSKDMELSMQPTEYVLETTPKAMKDMPMTPSEKV
ncbi:hypothetical protein Poli38472_001233 [Pythium oligandrum]|uniref:MARVEL domain-containing protein n=1 Tax=Pythium oligandrum TaxID=41045 RepID=A0A8K1FRK0_PYTOL|nr:hypothetical protein Poli38472_001233 [Pythium oligandrum]|eukprot:TMW69077.1 hypothetical protein Poli38472_001233 [Pythium oligandrum]